jgi:peptidylprolyl isomerase
VPGPGSKKLKIRIASGPPPKELVVRDLRKGTGPAVERLKDEIIVNYVGIDYATGKAFYDSWDQGGPSKFLLEETHKGWELGLKGMRAGGLRELVAPPRFEYGTTTFVYVIEMAKVRQAEHTRLG